MWLWVILWGVVPIGTYSGLEPDEHGARLYYTPTPWWCWINGRYTPYRIVAEYLWLWIAGVGTVCLYVPSYIILRKNRKEFSPIEKAGQEDRPFDSQSHSSSNSSSNSNSNSSSSQKSDNPAKMLYYPVAYTLCILPLSIMRWAAFSDPSLLSNPRMNPPSMVFGVTFYLMGLINVMLTIWVRPSILLIGSDGQLSSDDPRFIAEIQAERPDIIQMQRAGRAGGPSPNGRRVAASSLAGWNT
ncbi:hypothetical protein FRC10_011949 [Ceratobasidium sp. 414]|nr:hypothetical protein FRC10_011949 [Ceratobasidium sp. 414]